MQLQLLLWKLKGILENRKREDRKKRNQAGKLG